MKYAITTLPRNLLLSAHQFLSLVAIPGVLWATASTQFAEAGTFVNLDFNAAVAGTLPDTHGLGTGFTRRLPGTGEAIPINDPNIDLLSSPGRLSLTSTHANINQFPGPTGFNLQNFEAPGVLLTAIGSMDISAVATFNNVNIPTGSCALTLYAGVDQNTVLRVGITDLNTFIFTRNTGVGDKNTFSNSGAFNTGDDIQVTLSRRSGLWKFSWSNLTSAVAGSLPPDSLPWLDVQDNLYIGIAAANAGIPTPFVNTIDNFSVAVSLPSTIADNSYLTNGLAAFYPFNGNANDESGNGNNGVAKGALLSPNQFGKPNQAYKFNGTDSYIEIPKSTAFDSEDYTLSMWFNPERSGETTDMLISRGRNNFELELGAPPFTNQGFRFLPRQLSGDGQVWDARSTAFETNVWEHVVATYQQSPNIAHLFLNGQEVPLTHFSGPDLLNNSLPARLGMRYDGSAPFKGSLDQVRIYKRALSNLEVRALYEYESVARPSFPSQASATVQVVNGFVVGATVVKGGSDYTNAPNVTITGGGGTGATAVAVVANGVVTSISIINPGHGYSQTPSVVIDFPPYPPSQAKATATLINGFVTAISVGDGGFGYGTNVPSIYILGGGGSGATALALMQDGIVAGVFVTSAGSGYTSAPRVLIAAPPGFPSLAIEVSQIRILLTLIPGYTYKIQTDDDGGTWVDAGASFLATDISMSLLFDVNARSQMFRVVQVN